MTDEADAPAAPDQSPVIAMTANAAAIIAAVVTDFEEGIEYVEKAISNARDAYEKWAVANPALAALAEQAVRIVIGRLASTGIPIDEIEAVAADIFAGIAGISRQAAVQQIATNTA